MTRSRPPIVNRTTSPTITDVLVGNRIRLRRTTLGLPMTVVAKNLGASWQQLGKYEHGTDLARPPVQGRQQSSGGEQAETRRTDQWTPRRIRVFSVSPTHEQIFISISPQERDSLWSVRIGDTIRSRVWRTHR
jgi:hypothetical protein